MIGKTKVSVFLLIAFLLILSSCISSVVRAEEYYALGQAYYDLKKYAEAENWFNKAKFHQATRNASEYYLGRIAYDTGRYKDAEEYFERIINRDAENITALKAAAYTCIKLEELGKAEAYYGRVLGLVPESYDDGYNYALVLLAIGKAEEAENVLVRFNNTEDPKALIIIARSQKQQGKPEAADAYTLSLLKEDNPELRAEFAAYLSEIGHKEKALEQYRLALKNDKLTAEKKEAINNAIELLETDGKSGAETKQ